MLGKTHLIKAKETINNILQIGITEQDSEIESYAKYFTNCIAFLSVSLSFIHFLIYAIKYANSICLIYIVSLCLSLICFLLNHFGFGRIASLYILGLNVFVIILISIMGGFDMGAHPLLIVITLCSASILLSWWLALAFNIFSFIVFVIAHKYSAEVGPWLAAVIMPNRVYVNFGFVLVSAFITSRLILNTVLKYITSLQSALKEAQGYNEKIKKQNVRLEMFNTIAAHDLRTPTRQVISFVGMAKRNLKHNTSKEELNEYLGMISKAGYRMNELIESIAILNKIGYEENQEIISVDLTSVVSEIEDLEIKPNYDNVKVVYANLPTLNIRPNHLHLIFQNLMINAAKFNTNVEKQIRINSKTDSTHLFLFVEDNGIGIEDDFRDLVFEPFKKLHIHEEYTGAGLGLYIVSDILNQYNGKITTSQNEMGGSKFTIELPVTILSQ